MVDSTPGQVVETTIRLPTQRELTQEKYPATDQACLLSDHASKISKNGQLEAAIVAVRRALALQPDHPMLLSHLGAFLWDVGRYAEAEVALRRSIEIEPEYAPSHGNLGSVLGAQQKFAEGGAHFREALRIEPDFIDAKWNYGVMLLDAGQWTEGWPYCESRIERGNQFQYPRIPYPRWTGQDLNGKSIWVQGEQGVGDRILFSRYLAWLKGLYPECKIHYLLNADDLPNMANLMWGYRNTVSFVPNGIPWPEDIDYGVYLMSLPGQHGSTIENVPPDPGFVLAHTQRVKNFSLPPPNLPSLRVGIIWSGNSVMKRNIERSIPFELMMRLSELPNVVLYSLQFDNSDLYDFGAGYFIPDLTHDIKPMGFTGTARAMLGLDLIITACTSTAHLAGVLGVPCWVLLNANPYWLWLRGRSDSVWYGPNLRLFRQPEMFDWVPVYEEVRNELAELANKHAHDKEKQAA